MSGATQPPITDPCIVARGSLRDVVGMRDALRSAGIPAEIVRPPGRGGG